MTFPGNLPAATVSGTLRDTNGVPLKSAEMTFTPSVGRVEDPSSGDIFYKAVAKCTTDAVTGVFTVDLIPTNDPDETPINWTYTVTVSGTDNATPPAEFTDTFVAMVPHDTTDVFLAAVIQDGTTSGTVNPVSLGMLVDVNLVSTAPVDGDGLVYDAATKTWVPGTVSGGGSGLPSGGTTGQLLAKNSDTSGDAGWVAPPTLTSLGGIPAPSSPAGGQTIAWDAETSSWVVANLPVISQLAQYIIESSGSYAPRSTVTASGTQTVFWVGVDAPTLGGSYAVSGVDFWVKVPS